MLPAIIQGQDTFQMIPDLNEAPQGWICLKHACIYVQKHAYSRRSLTREKCM